MCEAKGAWSISVDTFVERSEKHFCWSKHAGHNPGHIAHFTLRLLSLWAAVLSTHKRRCGRVRLPKTLRASRSQCRAGARSSTQCSAERVPRGLPLPASLATSGDMRGPCLPKKTKQTCMREVAPPPLPPIPSTSLSFAISLPLSLSIPPTLAGS